MTLPSHGRGWGFKSPPVHFEPHTGLNLSGDILLPPKRWVFPLTLVRKAVVHHKVSLFQDKIMRPGLPIYRKNSLSIEI